MKKISNSCTLHDLFEILVGLKENFAHMYKIKFSFQERHFSIPIIKIFVSRYQQLSLTESEIVNSSKKPYI